MKQIVGLLIVAFFIGNINAQKIGADNVPAEVLNAFQNKFPDAKETKWKLNKGNYIVDCKVHSKSNILTLDFNGKIVKHYQDLYVSEIPKIVLKTIKSKSAYFDINDADRNENNGKITYDIDFSVNNKKNDFLIDESGKLLKHSRELKFDEVPESIRSVISTKYGELDFDKGKYTEDTSKVVYKIEGEINDKDHYFEFGPKATLLKHHQDLRDSEIPAPIQKALHSSYNGYEIRDADLIQENGKVIYEIDLKKSKEKISLKFNAKGKILEV